VAPKLSHRLVEFEHPAQGPHHCSQCKHWLGPKPDDDSCGIVVPPVTAPDWCKEFLLRTLDG